MPGGFGNSDIYYCTLQSDGSWSNPVNAGPTINTDGKEVFPVFDQNGTFYFSSDGHSGLGGLDIFETHGSKSNWSNPENLKYPVNSTRDDFLPYFTVPGLRGYLSSNRDGGKGADDIYYFSKQLTIIVKTKTKNHNNQIIPLEEVNLKFDDLVKDEAKDYKTDNNGIFSTQSDCGSAFEITGTKPGYFQQEKSVQTACSSGNDTMFVELTLEKLEENKSYVLENIYYDFDKWNIRPDAAVELDKLVNILNEYPNIDIELGSHTDSRGTSIYNETLSQKRAESAVAYIISKGIKAKRIKAKGYGEYKLRTNCPDGVSCSDEDHQLNRRTEFTVTKIHNK
jgi:outer membrane protein OmpA-like peptidoglycan-associated protein